MPAPPHQRALALRTIAKMWRLAARTFAGPPDAAFYRALCGLAQAPGLRAKGLTPLEPELLDWPPEQAITALAAEYQQLFEGTSPLCSPHAATYGVDACHQFLVLHGKRPDHVGTAFTVLAELYTTAAGQPGQLTPIAAAEAATDLLRLYTSRWVPGFLTAVRHTAGRALYRNVASMAADVLSSPSTLAILDISEDTMMLTIYSTPSCGFCYRLKSQLDREAIAYTDINIEDDPQAASYVESVNGGNQVVPTVVCPNGTVMTNPTIHDVKACIMAASAT